MSGGEPRPWAWGWGRADPAYGSGRSADVSLGKPAVPSPSPREGTAPAGGGGIAGCSWCLGQLGREQGWPLAPPHCPCAGCCCSQTLRSWAGSGSRASGDSKGTHRHSDSLWVCNCLIPVRGTVAGHGLPGVTHGRLRAVGVRLRMQNSHSIAINSTKITATKATPSLVCFSGLDFTRGWDPGVQGEGRTGGSEQLSVNRWLRGGGRWRQGALSPWQSPFDLLQSPAVARVCAVPCGGGLVRGHMRVQGHTCWRVRSEPSPGRYRVWGAGAHAHPACKTIFGKSP